MDKRLFKEWAPYTQNPWDPIKSPYRALYPQDELLIEKGGVYGLTVYKALLSDSAVQSAFCKFAQEVTSRPHLFIPAEVDNEEEAEIVEKLQRNVEAINFDSIIRGLLEFYIIGTSVGEVIYSQKNSEIFLDVKIRDPRRFVWVANENDELSLRMLTKENLFDGVEIPERKFIVPRYWSSSNGDPYGYGLAPILYPLVKFKRQALENNLVYSDRYATPTLIISAPQSATKSDIDELECYLTEYSSQRALILPQGFTYQYVTPNGSVEVFKDLNENLTREISVLITGEYEVGNVEAGSRSSSEVANLVRIIRAKEISELLYETINGTFVRWFVDANFGERKVYPRIERDFSDIQEDPTQLSIQDLATIQEKFSLQIDKDWIQQSYRFKAEEGGTEDENLFELEEIVGGL